MKNFVKDFQLKFPELVKQMHSSTHHYNNQTLNPYHIEGDVWCHTQMVCLMAEKLKTNKLVQLSALLHDVGKPMARKEKHEKQRVAFYGHEGASVFIGLDYLNTLDLTQQEKELICQMICLHTLPFKMVDRQTLVQKKIADRFIGNRNLLDNLIYLSAADAQGRWADDQDNSNPSPFGENFEDFWLPTLCTVQPKRLEGSYKGKVTVLVGPPGSGKSTWLSENIKENDIVLSRDSIVMEIGKGQAYNDKFTSVDQDKVNSLFAQRRKEAVASGKNIFLDMTNVSPKSRRKNLTDIPKNYFREAVVFYTSYNTLIERNENRKKDGKKLPLNVIHGMMENFTVPLLDEFDEVKSVF